MDFEVKINMLLVLVVNDHFITRDMLSRETFFDLVAFCTDQVELWEAGVRDVRINDTTCAVFSRLEGLEAVVLKKGVVRCDSGEI